jgi:hypothetical protein
MCDDVILCVRTHYCNYVLCMYIFVCMHVMCIVCVETSAKPPLHVQAFYAHSHSHFPFVQGIIIYIRLTGLRIGSFWPSL